MLRPRQTSNSISHAFPVLPFHRQDDHQIMDDTNRYDLEQALRIWSRMQNTHDPLQPGAQPEESIATPNPYSSDARVFSPAPPLLNVQSQASTSNQTSTIFLPNGLISHNATSASQPERLMAEHVYQPTQQQLTSSPDLSPSLNTLDQRVYQLTQMRHGAPHGQFNGGPYQPRHHPYGVPPSRTPHGSSSRHSQNMSQAPLPTDSTSSSSNLYETSQPHPPATPQVRTAEDQNRLFRLYKLQANQHQIPSPASLPQGVMYSPRGPSFQIPQTTQSVSTEGLSSSQTQNQSSVQSYGRIQTPTRSTQRAPPQSITLQGIPQAPTQNTPHATIQSTPRALLPSVPTSVHRPPVHSNPDLRSSTTKHVIQSTSQEPPFNVSTPPHPAQASSQSPSPPRVWEPQLQTVLYGLLPLQAQPDSEANHPDQKELVDATQKRPLAKLRPHEFVDYLTIEHNASPKFGVQRVYDMLFMQTLLFAKDEVLLVNPRNLQSSYWEPPQSIWHPSDMSGDSPHVSILTLMFKALNTISDLQPNEVTVCVDHPRHDSAVNIAKPNGGLIPGWAVAVSCEIRSGFPGLRPRNCYRQYSACFFSEDRVKRLNMDPVWKAKVLDVFKLRRNAKIANREDSMMNR